MKALITLTSSESKRLIAKGVKAMPDVINAQENHTIIVAGGTTNAFVAEELMGIKINDKSGYTMGIVTKGELGISQSTQKTTPFVIQKGQVQEIFWKDYLPKLKKGDVFIKGGNAVDHTGLAAVMVSDSMGGTIGAAQGILYARGVKLIVPIGLEKMIPDVKAAVEFMTESTLDESIGHKVGLIPMLGASVVTELTALEILYDLEARCIAAGGVDGSEGSVIIAIEGLDEEVSRAMQDIRALKGEPAVTVQ
ncbi:hypothetical protein Desor_3310 [Desulfosporosinus orientis DSM 765]|uniref:Uncharacterized protein n=1 Tax=Desulfosporosinus orientis (strain ATCC 19365 / DSM 765 / NCIMB 8382 / VKM B-1628 / Singapore I) TaxID=768706 RepID=G7WBQ1_DESOD|nr:hypothetical protein [Desulfosporosinus orientis]AET68809.1 hypothetical protein Desor_3310 [Desulfosporosinus orientis DSM 765]